MARGRNLKGLETALGYTFKRRALLERALTHASTRSDRKPDADNERLEFLGDRVLGLCMAELLSEIDTSASEGELARRFNRMVKKEACAEVARGLDLGAALKLSTSEEESGGRDKDTILADAMEAVLAAIFLEAGYEAARAVVRQLWAPMLEGLTESTTDAKSALQEWAQGQGLPLPRYVEIAREGPDHAPRFTTEVAITGRRPARGTGANKRAAEQAAATTLLILAKGSGALPIMAETPTPPTEPMPVPEADAEPATVPAPAQRCSFVAIVGAPNAGKSTLVNALVGAKISIVSHKVQTTRVPLRGIVIAGDAQIVLVDTPGLFQPRRRLDRAMVGAASSSAGDADVVALLVDAVRGVDDAIEGMLATLGGFTAPRILIITKVDRVKKESLLALAADLNQRLEFTTTFMISALDGTGVEDVKNYLARTAPLGPWHYPADEITDATERATAAEITREKVYRHLHDELPYSITVETTSWKDLKDGSVRIEQTLYVERESQRRIVLGESGRTIKLLSMEARKELGQMFERPVHLFLFVKVRENWENDPERYREMGLDFPKD